VDSYLVVGVNNYLVGSLPWYFKVFASLTGRHGDRAEGLRQVKQVTEQGNYAREDSKLMLAVLTSAKKCIRRRSRSIREMAHSYPRNYLLQYEVSNLLGTTNDWKSAAETYDSILGKHRAVELRLRNIPLAQSSLQSGQAYEHLQQGHTAVNRYLEAAALPGRIATSISRRSRRRIYTCASSVQTRPAPTTVGSLDGMPDTEEGKASRRRTQEAARSQVVFYTLLDAQRREGPASEGMAMRNSLVGNLLFLCVFAYAGQSLAQETPSSSPPPSIASTSGNE